MEGKRTTFKGDASAAGVKAAGRALGRTVATAYNFSVHCEGMVWDPAVVAGQNSNCFWQPQ